jgi:multidrug resistance efflux pump
MNSHDSLRPALSDRVRSLRLSGRDNSARPPSRFLPWVVSFVLLLTTAAFGYRAYRVGPMTEGEMVVRDTKKDDKAPISPSSEPATTSVAAMGEVVLQSKGYVLPLSQVQVSPKVGGQLVWIHEEFKEGIKFKKGDVLAIIEKVDYESDYKQAEYAHKAAVERYEELRKTLPEEVKQAEAELEENKQYATQQKLELDRNRRLTAGTAIAMRDLEQTQFTYDATLAKIKRLESTIRMIKDGRQVRRLRAAEFEKNQAEAAYIKAKWRYDNTEIVAPISGTVLSKKAELGNIVNPSAFSSGISASLCEMADLTKLEIDLSVQERDIASVKNGQACWIMPEAYQADKEFLARHPKGYRGEVSRLMPTADRSKGAVPVRVKVLDGEISEEEAGKYLRSDLSVTVSFLREMKEREPKK